MWKALMVTFSMASAVGTMAADELEQEAQQLVQQFIGQLQPQLKTAMSEGGPSRAIEVCATVAPRIADSLSTTSGWHVQRVSLQPRNASRASADAWEQQVLSEFERRQAEGEPAPEINYSERLKGQYRYMQAQGVGPVCLNCHGTELAESTRTSLAQYYPGDLATGYSLGQIRGAISLRKALPTENAER